MASSMPPYMTTPELRVGPGPPYTNPSMQINLFFRVLLGIVANLCCWVPMRLLWKNGEFAAAVYCSTIMTLNFYNVVNALLWRDDNVKDWYAGYGWCDLQMYTVFAMETLYSACIFAIMRNLATKVGMMRASTPTSSEKRRRFLIEALIIFPFPLLQVVMTYFVLGQRYNVSTLVGCTNVYYRTWPYLLVYHVPTNTFTLLTIFFAVLTWIRFRQVEKTTSSARHNTSSGMHLRHQRIRRKLYWMCVSIMVPFFPMQMFFLYVNIMAGLRYLQPYDFRKIHDSPEFTMVTFTTSEGISFVEMNMTYMAAITGVPLFWFFGFTKEALNVYRVYLLKVGLGRWFPKLHEEYDPDRTRTGSVRSWGQQISKLLKSGSGRAPDGSRKNSILPSFRQVSVATTTMTTTSSSTTSGNGDASEKHLNTQPPTEAEPNPWPVTVLPETATRPRPDQPAHHDDAVRVQPRNPFIFRTMLAADPFHLRLLFCRSRDSAGPGSASAQVPPSGHGSPSPLAAHARGDGRDGEGRVSLWSSDGGSGGARAKVCTRVWSEDEEIQSASARERCLEGNRRGDGEIGLAVGASSGGVRVETSIARSEEAL